MAQKNPITPEENRTANILSGISLGCMLLPMVMGAVQTAFLQVLQTMETEYPMWLSTFSSLGGIGFVASIVLIVIVRVKYPGNVFGKVLMWVYIILGIIAAFVFVVVAIACAIACNSTCTSCKGLY